MGYDVTSGVSEPFETGIGSQRVQRSSISLVSPLMESQYITIDTDTIGSYLPSPQSDTRGTIVAADSRYSPDLGVCIQCSPVQ